jgi:hypothetical protein
MLLRAILLTALAMGLAGCAMSESDARAAKARWENYVDEDDDIY